MTVKRDSSLLKCRKRTCKNVKCLKLPENNGTWDSKQKMQFYKQTQLAELLFISLIS